MPIISATPMMVDPMPVISKHINCIYKRLQQDVQLGLQVAT